MLEMAAGERRKREGGVHQREGGENRNEGGHWRENESFAMTGESKTLIHQHGEGRRGR